MNKTNGQSSIAWKSGFKCSQGSETLIGTGVNYLLGQVTGQRKRTFPLIFQGRAWLENDFGGRDAGDQRKPSACEGLYGRVSPPAPLGRCDLPYLRWQSARNVVAVFPGDHAHALLFRYSARSGVGNRFGNAKHGKLEHFKPVVSYCVTCFGHQTLTLPRQSQPETAIISFTSEQANCADQLVRGAS
jgi:hypothetical protein